MDFHKRDLCAKRILLLAAFLFYLFLYCVCQISKVKNVNKPFFLSMTLFYEICISDKLMIEKGLQSVIEVYLSENQMVYYSEDVLLLIMCRYLLIFMQDTFM